MKIKRMTACFGCLAHETLELDDGLNVLTLPNEGGKSTWCAFLRVMLYGLNTRERDKKGFLAEKNHYQPWNGGAMEGELLSEWQGREHLIRRYTKGTVPMGAFEAIWVDSGEAVFGINADNLGDIMIGVSRDVFERSAFLGQSAHMITRTNELDKRLSALVSSGEENVSAAQVKERLSDWKRKRQYNNKGEIPVLETKRKALLSTISDIQDETTKIREHQLEIDRLHTLESQLQHQVSLHEARQADLQAQRYMRAEQELAAAKAKLDTLEAQLPQNNLPSREDLESGRDQVAELRALDQSLKQAREQLPQREAELKKTAAAASNDSVFSGDGASAREMAQQDAQQYEQLSKRRSENTKKVWLFPILFLIIGVAVSGALYYSGVLSATISGYVFYAFLAIGILLHVTFRKKSARIDADIMQLITKYQSSESAQYIVAAEQYCARLDAKQRAEEELSRANDAVRTLETQRNALWQALHQLVSPFAPEVKEVYGFTAAIAKVLTLLESIDSAAQQYDSAQRIFDTVAEHGIGSNAAVSEQPSITIEQAISGLQEVQRRISTNQSALSMALGRRSTLGEPEDLQAQLEQIELALARNRVDYEALSVAIDALEAAETELRERFSPQLNMRAGEYLSCLTQGRYHKVRINREMEASAESVESIASRSTLSLSQGTVDQLWLAVRLAVCDLALSQEESCPIVLDDALVNFDDDRLLPALQLLEKMAQERQILLFSCHDREKNMIRSLHNV